MCLPFFLRKHIFFFHQKHTMMITMVTKITSTHTTIMSSPIIACSKPGPVDDASGACVLLKDKNTFINGTNLCYPAKENFIIIHN